MLTKIVSGGQTGVDRAALDVAIAWGMDYGGWIPSDRSAEDGIIPARYTELKVTHRPESAYRTEQNVKDSDGTLILSPSDLVGGSLLTKQFAMDFGRPVLCVKLCDVCTQDQVEVVASWVKSNNISVLNIAGPRESEEIGVYEKSSYFMQRVLAYRDSPSGDMSLANTIFFEMHEHIRHWDNIRWLVPVWFTALIGGFVALVEMDFVSESKVLIFVAALLAAFVGYSSCVLLENLVKYHVKIIRLARERLFGLFISQRGLEYFEPMVSYDFEGDKIRDTATYLLVRLVRWGTVAVVAFMLFYVIVS